MLRNCWSTDFYARIRDRLCVKPRRPVARLSKIGKPPTTDPPEFRQFIGDHRGVNFAEAARDIDHESQAVVVRPLLRIRHHQSSENKSLNAEGCGSREHAG
jgi:hypothetical protein